MTPDDCERCFYCRMPLAGRHEHDHAPIPARLGGEDTVPTCHNCHNLKDRMPLNHWPAELALEAIEECGPLGRIFLAKAFAVAADQDALDELAAP